MDRISYDTGAVQLDDYLQKQNLMKKNPVFQNLTIAILFWLHAPALLSVNAQDVQVTTGKLAPVLQPFVDSHTLAGAVVLVADPQKVLDIEAVGFSDIAAGKKMRTDAMFWIASQSKPMTCTALMILVDEGKVNVDDPVEKYLPEFKGQMFVAEKDDEHAVLRKPKQIMLVRHVMSHTSGLPGVTPIMQPKLDAIPLSRTVIANSMISLATEPGTKYQYANPGINTVGRIVEVVSGMPYEQFMQERIFTPMGMSDTTFWPNREQLTRLAKSYRPTADKKNIEETTVDQLQYPLDDHVHRHAFPGGGLFSTAGDLSRFYRMLANQGNFEGKRILSEQSIAQMTVDQTGDLKQGYGFGYRCVPGSIGHGGAYGTYSSFDPERKLVTIFLGQHAGWSNDGKTILKIFQTAATEMFAPGSPNANSR